MAYELGCSDIEEVLIEIKYEAIIIQAVEQSAQVGLILRAG